MVNISDDLKKIVLAGIGAVAVTAEKSKDVVETLVKKGQLTVEQGKILNEELKRTVKENIKEKSEEHQENYHSEESIIRDLDKMTKEEIKAIKDKISELESVDLDGSEEEEK